MWLIFYKDIELNKIYRSRVRAASEIYAMECLRNTLNRKIEILSIEEISENKKIKRLP